MSVGEDPSVGNQQNAASSPQELEAMERTRSDYGRLAPSESAPKGPTYERGLNETNQIIHQLELALAKEIGDTNKARWLSFKVVSDNFLNYNNDYLPFWEIRKRFYKDLKALGYNALPEEVMTLLIMLSDTIGDKNPNHLSFTKYSSTGKRVEMSAGDTMLNGCINNCRVYSALNANDAINFRISVRQIGDEIAAKYMKSQKEGEPPIMATPDGKEFPDILKRFMSVRIGEMLGRQIDAVAKENGLSGEKNILKNVSLHLKGIKKPEKWDIDLTRLSGENGKTKGLSDFVNSMFSAAEISKQKIDLRGSGPKSINERASYLMGIIRSKRDHGDLSNDQDLDVLSKDISKGSGTNVKIAIGKTATGREIFRATIIDEKSEKNGEITLLDDFLKELTREQLLEIDNALYFSSNGKRSEGKSAEENKNIRERKVSDIKSMFEKSGISPEQFALIAGLLEEEKVELDNKGILYVTTSDEENGEPLSYKIDDYLSIQFTDGNLEHLYKKMETIVKLKEMSNTPHDISDKEIKNTIGYDIDRETLKPTGENEGKVVNVGDLKKLAERVDARHAAMEFARRIYASKSPDLIRKFAETELNRKYPEQKLLLDENSVLKIRHKDGKENPLFYEFSAADIIRLKKHAENQMQKTKEQAQKIEETNNKDFSQPTKEPQKKSKENGRNT